MIQLTEHTKQNKIDIALLVETNTKQTTSATDKMNNQMKDLGRNTQIICADSKLYSTTNSSRLQGVMMNIL